MSANSHFEGKTIAASQVKVGKPLGFRIPRLLRYRLIYACTNDTNEFVDYDIQLRAAVRLYRDGIRVASFPFEIFHSVLGPDIWPSGSGVDVNIPFVNCFLTVNGGFPPDAISVNSSLTNNHLGAQLLAPVRATVEADEVFLEVDQIGYTNPALTGPSFGLFVKSFEVQT